MDTAKPRNSDSICQRYEESERILEQPELPELIHEQLDYPSRGKLTGAPQACRQGREEAQQQEVCQASLQAVLS